MRHFVLLFFLLVVTVEMANSQPFLNVGIRAGGNSSSITFVPRIRDRVASVQGYQIGGTVQYVNMEHLGIQLDGMLINQGWRQVADDQTEITHKIDFLHFPFTSYVYMGKRNTRFFINAGIYLNFRMNGTRTVTSPDGATQTFDYNYRSERDNLVVYGLSGGGGISYDIGIGIIGADLRISYSYGNIMKPSVPERDFSREQVLSINGFYQFKIISGRSRSD
jgi:hypothetical protein